MSNTLYTKRISMVINGKETIEKNDPGKIESDNFCPICKNSGEDGLTEYKFGGYICRTCGAELGGYNNDNKKKL